MPIKSRRIVHGDDLLYLFFRDVFADEPAEARAIAQRLISATAIWLPLSVYHDWPVLLPWVVRDPACRGSKANGVPDRWSAPDEKGYLTDDNSLVKALPRSLAVTSTAGSRLQGAHMGTEFVASHIWREVDHPDLASRIPLLNSFVPNLAWLPTQISKLSDREGSPLQRVLQGMSWTIYREAPVAAHLRPVVADAWNLIPPPTTSAPVDLSALNWFEPTPRFFATRRTRLKSVIAALEELETKDSLTKKVIATRYTEGLPKVSPSARSDLLACLSRFAPPEDS